MQADVFVLYHHPPGLEAVGDIKVLVEMRRGRLQPQPQVGFLAVLRKGNAIHRADIDAGVTFDAQRCGEYGLDVAVQAALGLAERQLDVIAQFDFGADVLERDDLVAMRHLETLVAGDVVVVAPFVDAHLLRRDLHLGKRTLGDVFAGDKLVDRKRGIVAVRHRPDDIFGAERGVATEEHLGIARAHGLGIDLGHVPLVEFDAAVALDPGKGVLLADRHQHVVASNRLVRLARGHQVAPAIGIVLGLHLLEGDAGELAIVVNEGDRHHEIEDRNILMEGVFFLPGARLHLLKAGTHDHLDVLAAETARGAAAVHRGIAATEHDHALAALVGVAERHRGEPVDTDVNIGPCFLAPGYPELAAARHAGADEDRVVAFAEQLLQAVYAPAASELDAEIEDVIGLLVDHGIRQPEFRNLGSHHAARLRVGIEHRAVIAERRQVARDGERGGATTDDRNALAVFRSRPRHPVFDVILEVGGYALQPADRDRSVFDAAAAARGLARTIAGPSQNSRKYIRFPVDHVSVAIAAFSDQPDVFWNWRVRGTGPLAVDNFVKVVGCRNISRFHSYLVRAMTRSRAAFKFCCERSSRRSCGFPAISWT